MRAHIWILAGIVVLGCVSACEHSDEKTLLDTNGIVIGMPHTWKTSISDDGELSNSVIATAIIHNNNVLVGAQREGGRAILSLNSSNGRVNWQWNDLLTLLTNPGYKDPITLYTDSYHLNNNRFFFTYTSSSYCLDIATGQTLWKYKQNKHRFDRNAGIDDTYFTSGSQYDPVDDEKIYTGSVTSSTPEELLLVPEYTPVSNPLINAQGWITKMTSFKIDGEVYLAFGIENPYKDFTTSGWGFTELNLYNVTQKKYVYKKFVINPSFETRVIEDLSYYEKRLYFISAKYFHAYDALSGKEVLRTYVGTSPLLSSLIRIDNKFYMAGEDRYLYCFDATTGQILWKELNTGTCTELSYLNGILYYLGGGDGLLHAVDASNGKHLWKISSPDLKVNRGAWFYGLCAAIPGKNGGKGVVVATTGLNAYAFEAIR